MGHAPGRSGSWSFLSSFSLRKHGKGKYHGPPRLFPRGLDSHTAASCDKERSVDCASGIAYAVLHDLGRCASVTSARLTQPRSPFLWLHRNVSLQTPLGKPSSGSISNSCNVMAQSGFHRRKYARRPTTAQLVTNVLDGFYPETLCGLQDPSLGETRDDRWVDG